MSPAPHVIIGIVVYNNSKYVDTCIPHLLKQDYPNCTIAIFDNGSNDDTVEKIRKYSDTIEITKNDINLGFGKAHNHLINKYDAPFYLCLNIDMFLEKDFASKLVSLMQKFPKTASVCGKIRKWDFENDKKTMYIDSVGLLGNRHHTFQDIGQGEIDVSQYDEEREIFGCSGAAVMYRTRYLKEIGYMGNNSEAPEYFDELMFMYKEDIDLAYRLRWAGFSAHYTPNAVAYHDRTAYKGSLLNRKKGKSLFIRKHSLLNQTILEKKHFSPKFSLRTKAQFQCYRLLRWVYIRLFERDLLSAYEEIDKVLRKVENRKKKLKQNILPKKMEDWFIKA